MKLLSKTQALVLTALANMIVFAQDKAPDLKVDVNSTTSSPMGGGDWMSNPLIWVIGALVVILLVALVARGGGSKS